MSREQLEAAVPGAGPPPVDQSTIGVLICSYKRPGDLMRGLCALAAQERRPDDVIVVARATDTATLEALAAPRTDGLPLRVLTVTAPGTVHALNTGLDACSTDLLAITDDDTVPHPDWLKRIAGHFDADPDVGGVSGRDWVHDGERFDDRSMPVVGQLQWFGRAIGNHHLGVGPPREVHFFKGANMSYRAKVFETVRFDTRLRGTGAQPSEDMAFSMAVRMAGWKLIYDPLVALDHYPGKRDEPRHYAGVAADRSVAGVRDLAHNEIVAQWQGLTPAGRGAYVIWSVLVGTGVSPGLVQAIRFTRPLGLLSWRRFIAVQRGKLAGYWSLAVQTKQPGRRPAAP